MGVGYRILVLTARSSLSTAFFASAGTSQLPADADFAGGQEV